jgi:hypothetical protein
MKRIKRQSYNQIIIFSTNETNRIKRQNYNQNLLLSEQRSKTKLTVSSQREKQTDKRMKRDIKKKSLNCTHKFVEGKAKEVYSHAAEATNIIVKFEAEGEVIEE